MFWNEMFLDGMLWYEMFWKEMFLDGML